MPTAADAPGLWMMSALGGLAIAAMIYFGRGPWTVYGTIRRSENPGLFWTLIAIFGALDFALVFAALLASVPWPPKH